MSWSVQPHSLLEGSRCLSGCEPFLQCGLPCCMKGYCLVCWDPINAPLCKATHTASMLLMHQDTKCDPELKLCICRHIGNITQGLQIVLRSVRNSMLAPTVSTILHASQANQISATLLSCIVSLQVLYPNTAIPRGDSSTDVSRRSGCGEYIPIYLCWCCATIVCQC